jgi:hypothetical protein
VLDSYLRCTINVVRIFKVMDKCKVCNHALQDHEYIMFNGIEEYGMCTQLNCKCQVFLGYDGTTNSVS